MAQLVETLSYKPGVRVFDSRWGHWYSSVTESFRHHYGLVSTQPLTEMSTLHLPGGRGGGGGRCVGLTTLPLLCADDLKVLGTSTSWIPMGLCRPVLGELQFFTFV